MKIADVHDVIRKILLKEIDGWIDPPTIDSYLDRAQMAVFNDYYTNIRNIDPSTQRPAIGYGALQRINDALKPFKVKQTFTGIDTPSGVLTLGTGYMYLISLYTTQYDSDLGRNVTSPVSVINEEELSSRLESQIVPVDLDAPIAIMNAQNKIQLFPETGMTGTAWYFRRPLAPKYAYTQSGRTFTNDPLTSVDLEWGDQEINNIIAKALVYAGLSLTAQDVEGFGIQKDKEGQ